MFYGRKRILPFHLIRIFTETSTCDRRYNAFLQEINLPYDTPFSDNKLKNAFRVVLK
jgi:hypothetical protein